MTEKPQPKILLIENHRIKSTFPDDGVGGELRQRAFDGALEALAHPAEESREPLTDGDGTALAGEDGKPLVPRGHLVQLFVDGQLITCKSVAPPPAPPPEPYLELIGYIEPAAPIPVATVEGADEMLAQASKGARRPAQRGSFPEPVSADKRAKAVAFAKKHNSYAAAAKEFGVAANSVRNWAKAPTSRPKKGRPANGEARV